jgi:hypothetical protein
MLFLLVMAFFFSLHAEEARLPIGMNLGSTSYHDVGSPFIDLKKSSSEFITFNATGDSSWNTEKLNEIQRDLQGYPLEIPAPIASGPPQKVRFLINNHRAGQYRLLWDGEGSFGFSVAHANKNGEIILTLNGSGENSWITIDFSKKGNPIRNIRILPLEYAKDPNPPLFYPLYVEGLNSFHCLRFMDWMETNGSTQESWSSRVLSTYHTQGGDRGICIEYAILLCNKVKADGWFCVPHKADDDYIRNFALLVRDSLDPAQKVYLEYSNEVWNAIFSQTHYVWGYAPGAKNRYVSETLEKMGPNIWFEKAAFMMQRVFAIWEKVFEGPHRNRLIRAATTQHHNPWLARVILGYLFKKDQQGNPLNTKEVESSTGKGCDALSPGGYFSFTDADEKKWLSMPPENLEPELILEAVMRDYPEDSQKFTDQNAFYANAYHISYVVYEGGQHMVPFGSNDNSPYNLPVWNAQISPMIFDIYMELFKAHAAPPVNCKLFCAYKYVSPRKKMWGSWGHIESLDQIKNITDIRTVAPKFSALLQANLPK